MQRRVFINGLLFTLCLTPTLEQTIYNAGNFYKPMTDLYDPRHRGGAFLPPCIKDLLNCWETIKPDLFCKYGPQYRQLLESICMDMRMQCLEFLGPQPFEKISVAPWNFCPPTLQEHWSLNLDPLTNGVN